MTVRTKVGQRPNEEVGRSIVSLQGLECERNCAGDVKAWHKHKREIRKVRPNHASIRNPILSLSCSCRAPCDEESSELSEGV